MTVAEPHATAKPPLFSRRVKVIATLLALMLTAWLAVAWYGRSQVQVVAAEESLACQGTEVVFEAAIGHRDVQVPYAVVDEQMRCVLRFRVENRGPLPARLHRITVGGYGPDGGHEAEAVWLASLDIEPIRRENHPDSDAVFVLEPAERLRGGEARHFEVALVFRPPGCRGRDSWFSVPDSPAVKVGVWGIPGDRVLSGDSFGLKCVRR